MTNTTRFTRRPIALAALAATALLAACGGGRDGDSLTAEVAQGYAADGVTMSVGGASGVDVATETLEAALATNAAAAASRETAQAADATPAAAGSATGTVACPNGGTVAWTVTGDSATLGNGQLDAGETYAVTYTACGTADSNNVLDGNTSLAVTTRSGGNVAFTHTMTNLKQTITNGTTVAQYLLNGSTSVSRTVTTPTGGGRQVTRQITSPYISLTSTISGPFGTRNAMYYLRQLDWTVVRTYNAAGALTTRTHQGAVIIDAMTPRRPNATLSITTQGTLTLDGSDGAAAQGSFTVATSRNTIACTYGNGVATLTLDLGNDGTIDRTWTLTRTGLIGEAG
jgi:hypothetical protein